MGAARAINLANIQGYQNGVLTSVEVIVPGPWFLDAAQLLQQNPKLDVGVHLTLTAEWRQLKWGPITNAPSLMTSDGYFPASVAELLELKPRLDEIERELRAQIELALKHIPQVSHLSNHMGAAAAPELVNILGKLSREFQLPIAPHDMVQSSGMWAVPAADKKQVLLDRIANLPPGLTMIVVHPALNTGETRAMIGDGNDASTRMAVHREVILNTIISQDIKSLIKEQNIKLVSYADTFK